MTSVAVKGLIDRAGHILKPFEPHALHRFGATRDEAADEVAMPAQIFGR